MLSELFESAKCPIIHRSVAAVGVGIADLYAACDLVAFPSTWEGFGNPLVEAALHGRPAVVDHYPVLDELTALGLEWLSIDDIAAIRAELAEPNEARLARNRSIAERELSMDALFDRLQDLFDRAGWSP
jgi:glycosyltransferase involved in cell wall biosynthesis